MTTLTPTGSKNGFGSSTLWTLASLGIAALGPAFGLSAEDAKNVALGGLVVIGAVERVKKGDIHFTPDIIRNAIGAGANILADMAARRAVR